MIQAVHQLVALEKQLKAPILKSVQCSPKNTFPHDSQLATESVQLLCCEL